MDFFQTIGVGVEKAFDSVSDLGQRVRYEAELAKGNSKIRLQKKEEENKLKLYYRELGESYYNDVSEGEEILRPVDEIIKDIEKVKEEIYTLDNSLRCRKFKEPVKEEEGVLRCSYCNEILDPDDRFCANCGTPTFKQEDFGEGYEVDDVVVHTKICPNCKQQLNIHAKFCTRCGETLE